MFVGKRMAAGATVATMIGAAGLAATAPANAAAVDGQTVVTFNKATWKALDKGGIMVEGVGKAEPINVRSFGFPAKQVGNGQRDFHLHILHERHARACHGSRRTARRGGEVRPQL